MRPADFDTLARLVRERSGLVLTPDKAYLLESRLAPIARKWGLSGLEELVERVRSRPDPALLADIVDAMTTNESLFFRDIKPFDLLRERVLPQLLAARPAGSTIRIWSAACSSGQEPFSIAMLLKEEAARLSGWRFEIVATDICRHILDRARSGAFSQFEVQRGLPIGLLLKYFKQEGERWVISPEIRSMVSFREFNLLDDPRPLGRFDVVFCRNVLIYFDGPTKARILGAMARQMPEDGTLYLGGAETVLGVTDCFEPVPSDRGIYRPSVSQPADRRVSVA